MKGPEDIEENIIFASAAALRHLSGSTPRLIDQWQLAPQLWDAVRFEVDHKEQHIGQFILTGLAVLLSREKINEVPARKRILLKKDVFLHLESIPFINFINRCANGI